MTKFREWLLADETRMDVYETALAESLALAAAHDLVEFYNIAVSGRWELILENSSEEEDDDGPVEIDDPFADGDENAKPVEEIPEDDPPIEDLGADEEPEEESEEQKAERQRKKVALAKRVKKLAQMVRWGAMLDRKKTIDAIEIIYRDEWLPLMRRREEQMKEHYDSLIKSENMMSEEEAVRITSEIFGLSQYEIRKIVRRSVNEWRTILEADDEWEMPEFENEEPFDEDLKAVMEKIKPLLARLGHLDPGQISANDSDNIKVVSKAIESAINERGNDPPKDEEGVKELESKPGAWERAKSDLGMILYDRLAKASKRRDRDTSRYLGAADGVSGSKSRYGAKYHQGWEDILNHSIIAIFKSLTERSPNKDGTVPAWKEDLTVFKFDPESEPGRAINSWKKSIKMGSMDRDESRAEKKAAAMKSSSTDAVVHHDAGAMGDDGTITSMDPADMRTRGSLSTATTAQTANTMIDAFKQAMVELKERDPSQALLVCLWLGIRGQSPMNCARPDGPIPDNETVTKMLTAASGVNLSSRNAPATFLRKLGLDQLMPGTERGRAGRANWELIRIIKTNNIPTHGGVLDGMPPGDLPPDWTPNYTKRHSFDDSQKMWWKYMNRVIDTLSKKSLPFVIRRMHEIISERDDTQKPKGWVSPCSWSISKFLNDTFMDEIRSGGVSVEGSSPRLKVVIHSADRKRRPIRSYTITVEGQRINVAQDGRESVFSYELPLYDIKCPSCNGSGGNCPDCEGCGKTMDRIKVLKVERDIHARLITKTINRPPRGV